MALIGWLLGLAGIIGVVGIFIFIPIGIVFLIKAASANDQEVDRKKALKKKGIIFVLLPFIIIASSLILTIILNFTKTMMGM
ncbi:hypothetical protein ACFL08_00400 [Patescibacteria group bacterium]